MHVHVLIFNKNCSMRLFPFFCLSNQQVHEMNTPVNTTLQTLLYIERLYSENWFTRGMRFMVCIMVIYICIKFQENISNSFHVTEWAEIYYRNHYFQSSKGHNSKSRLNRVTVLYNAPCHIMLYICMKFHQNIWKCFQLTEKTLVHSSNGYFNIYYVQKAETPKEG